MNTLEIIAPIISGALMGLIGWLTAAYRNKQKKEKDILDNVQQMLDMERQQINIYAERLAKSETDYHKLEKKFDHKTRAVKEAYDCEHPSENCPVLIYDKSQCEDCKIKRTVNENA